MRELRGWGVWMCVWEGGGNNSIVDLQIIKTDRHTVHVQYVYINKIIILIIIIIIIVFLLTQLHVHTHIAHSA